MWRGPRGTAGLALLLVLPVLLAGLAAGREGEKDRLLFRPRPADTYPARDSHEGLIVAADPFDSREKARTVFGKQDLQRAGILPVLVVITNSTDKTVRLDNLSVQLITPDRQKIQPTPSGAVLRRLGGKEGRQPQDPVPSRLPRIPRSSRSGAGLEVQVHEFSMRMALPNSTVGGFFYFDVGRGVDGVSGAKVYVTQLFWAHNAQPLMYYEISLDDALRAAPPTPSTPSK